ncbi:hypothetical protein IJT17_08690, partial [bacterium]|nr:hypothetical protein [bacterium]
FPEIPVPGEHEQPQLPTDGPKPGVPNPSMMYGMFPSLPTPGENKIPGDFEFPEGLKPDAEPHNMYGVFFPHDPIGGGQKIELLGGQEEKPNTLGFGGEA